ncbi:hypothetical protein [Lysinibacillus xylanilyticus]|uniref:hypothetical protein n=1 Tax=Lysinibacillus xylanilyticus TaxID=582475 RepID=UPI003CFCFC97
MTSIVWAQAAHRTPPESSALRESEATATNVFYAKAKRQQQMFSVTKRPDGTEINHALW